MPTFRHWTYAHRVPSILEHGLRGGDNILSMTSAVGPPVVWLLPVDVEPGTGDENGLMDAKRGGWVDVDVPAIRWLDWEPQTRMDPHWRDIMVRAGGGPDVAARWYIFPGNIRPSRIVGSGTR